MPEQSWLVAALLAYAFALLRAAQAVPVWQPLTSVPAAAPRLRWTQRLPSAAAVLAVAVALHTLALALRWQAQGHGPFTTLHEILSSSLWSLSLVLLLGSAAVRELRQALIVAAPVLLVLGTWLGMADARPGHMPPTYDTPLLYLHAVVGKAYLGLLLAAVSLAWLPALQRGTGGPATRLRCDGLAHRFAAAAFVCETLMLIVGAVWAQDAWGRWWAWDPLESWSFVSWLALAATLHARAGRRPSPRAFAIGLSACFVLAFLTFFGVPYLSVAPHKGAI